MLIGPVGVRLKTARSVNLRCPHTAKMCPTVLKLPSGCMCKSQTTTSGSSYTGLKNIRVFIHGTRYRPQYTTYNPYHKVYQKEPLNLWKTPSRPPDPQFHENPQYYRCNAGIKRAAIKMPYDGVLAFVAQVPHDKNAGSIVIGNSKYSETYGGGNESSQSCFLITTFNPLCDTAPGKLNI